MEKYKNIWLKGNPNNIVQYTNQAHHLVSFERAPSYVRITEIGDDSVETKSLYSKEQAHSRTVEQTEWDGEDYILVAESWNSRVLNELIAEEFLKPVDSVPEYVEE